MKTTELQKIEGENKMIKDFEGMGKRAAGRTANSDPANMKESVTSATIEQPLTLREQQSLTVNYLKKEHQSLSQIVKTIRDHFEDAEVKRFIDMLQSVETDVSKKRVPIKLTAADFDFKTVFSLYPQITTKEGTKKACRFGKVNDSNRDRVAVTYKEGKPISTIEKNGDTEIGLFEITLFSVSDVIRKVVRSAKNGALEKKRIEKAEKMEAAKAAKAAEKQATKETTEEQKVA